MFAASPHPSTSADASFRHSGRGAIFSLDPRIRLWKNQYCPAGNFFGDWATPKGLRRDFFIPSQPESPMPAPTSTHPARHPWFTWAAPLLFLAAAIAVPFNSFYSNSQQAAQGRDDDAQTHAGTPW